MPETPESDDDDAPEGLLSPFGNAAALAEMQAYFNGAPSAKDKTLAFFESLGDPQTRFDFATFQKHWHAVDQHDFSFAELAQILHASALWIKKAGASDSLKEKDLKKNCLSEVMFRLKDWGDAAKKRIKAGDYSQANLALCMWDFKELDTKAPKKFRQVWYGVHNPAEILRSANNETDRKIVRTIVSYAVAGLKPSDKFREAWLSKAQQFLPEFTAVQLTYSLWAHARLAGPPPEDFLTAWMDRFKKSIAEAPEEFRARDLSNIMGACAALHAISGNETYRTIATKAYSMLSFSNCTIGERRQTGYACLWFDLDMGGHELPLSNQRRSKMETKITDAFKAAGFAPNIDSNHIDAMKHKPDITLEGDECDVVLEIDGPDHFLEEINNVTGELQTAGFNGRTLLVSALMVKLAAQAVIVRMPFTTIWQILKSRPEDQNSALKDLIAQARAQARGGFHARKVSAGQWELCSLDLAAI